MACVGLDDLNQLPFEEMRALATAVSVASSANVVVEETQAAAFESCDWQEEEEEQMERQTVPAVATATSANHQHGRHSVLGNALRENIPLTVVEAAGFVSCEQAVSMPELKSPEEALEFLCSSTLVEEDEAAAGRAVLHTARTPMMAMARCLEEEEEEDLRSSTAESLEDVTAAAVTASQDDEDYYHLGRQSVAVEETSAFYCCEEEEEEVVELDRRCSQTLEAPRCCSVTVEQQEAFVAEASVLESSQLRQRASSMHSESSLKLATVTSLPAVFEEGSIAEETEGSFDTVGELSPLIEAVSTSVGYVEEEDDEAKLMVVDVKTSVMHL